MNNRHRWIISLIVTIVYLMICSFFLSFKTLFIVLFSIIPVAVSGWLLGLKKNLIFTFLVIIANLLILEIKIQNFFTGTDPEILYSSFSGLGVLLVFGIMSGSLSDSIRQKKELINQLQISEKKYLNLMDSAIQPIAELDYEGNFLFMNVVAAKEANISDGKHPNVNQWDVFPPEIAEKQLNHVRQVIDSKQNMRFISISEIQGEQRWFDTTINPVYALDGTVKTVLLIVNDITEIKKMEMDIRNSEEKYRGVVKNNLDGIAISNDRNIILEWNPAMERISGISAEEAIGKNVLEIDQMLIPDKIKQSADHSAPGETNLEKLHTGKKILISKMRSQITNREGKHTFVEMSAFPVNLESGFLNVKIVRDVDQRVRNENVLKQYDYQLRHANEELRQFVYTASHDLKEPLRSVISFSNLLEKRYSNILSGEGTEFLNFIVNGAKRMEKMITSLLQYSRIESQELQAEILDCMDIIKDVKDNLSTLIAESETVLNYEELPPVYGDRNQIIRLFQNLIQNAIKYSKSGIKPIIDIEHNLQEEHIRFSVRDNGIGMDQNEIKLIFLPFKQLNSSTKYSGSGMGLNICKRIVDKHQGEIWVESESGFGSTFHFTLPANPTVFETFSY